MANFRGLLHHKPVRIFFVTKCTNIGLILVLLVLLKMKHLRIAIISSSQEVPEVAILRGQRGHLGASIEFWLTIHHWKHVI